MKGYHAESLLRVPLVEAMLGSTHVALVPRAVDSRWTYENVIPISVAGFNPFSAAVYYCKESQFARWLPHAANSARDFNEADVLVREVLFAVHDFLHAWAYALINKELGTPLLGHAKIGRHNLEKLAFLHLVTEAAATVGLDYWYLSRVELDSVLRIGTRVRTLTVPYHEADLDEYRRFNRGLTVQNPTFFGWVCDLYCRGACDGFEVHALKQSPKLFAWMRKELVYGAKQRQFIREWLRLLSPRKLGIASLERDQRPVECNADWQRALIARIGHQLWELVHHAGRVDDSAAFSNPQFTRTPRWSSTNGIDYRFINANAVKPRIFGDSKTDSSRFLAYQLIARHDYSRVAADVREELALRVNHSPLKVRRLLKGASLVSPTIGPEPRDLMFLA